MNLDNYIINSFLIFVFSFVLGIYINRFFEFLHEKYKVDKNLELLLAFAQLFVIILITYYLHLYKIFNLTFEYYNPHILFSSFLFSLQTNMINIFKKYI